MVQVTDFGASKAVETGRDMTLNVGTVAYVHNPSLHPRLPLALPVCLPTVSWVRKHLFCTD